jgi:polyisoprenyl-phosphate glycosyltransferase
MSRDEFRRPPPVLSVVVPLYDEEAVIPVLVDRLARALDELGVDSEVLLIDDGSNDGTPAAIQRAHARDPRFVGFCLSRNFGHQVAISAGLEHARGEAVVVMDGDLQDPPEAIPALWARLKEGFDVVYAIRASRSEGLLKRLAYSAYYRLLRRMVSIEIPLDAGDFGILSRRVVDLINRMPERRRFVRGLRAWAGFQQTGLRIDRARRVAGEPKYTIRKLAGLALDGLVGFGEAPLRWAGGLGAVGVLMSMLGSSWFAARAMIGWGGPTSGQAGGLLALFLGGAQLLSMAILGEYVSRIAQEVYGRPLYVIRRRIGVESPPHRGSRPRRRRSARGALNGTTHTAP